MLEIIPATEIHIPQIQKIANETWPDTFKAILSKDQIAYMLDMMYATPALQRQMQEGSVFLLALWNGEPGGFAAYELNYKDQPLSKLHKIYILPTMQGKSVGKALIQKVAEIATTAGMKGVSLNVNRDNKAIGFYERHGFRKIGEEDINIGNGFFMNDAIMQMDL